MTLVEFESISADSWNYDDAVHQINKYIENNCLSDKSVKHIDFIRQTDNFNFILTTKMLVSFE